MTLASELARELRNKRRWFVLTGAGCSTGSGIPDYRDDAGAWKHARPMTYQEFTGSLSSRRRYWARSSVGYRRISGAQPNPAHLALAELEREGRVGCLVTQNVDSLHRASGSERVIDLHGRLDRVDCLKCGAGFSREQFQSELVQANQGLAPAGGSSAPDGDAEIGDFDYERYVVPCCKSCGGMLKPAVVFFGESVPPARVEQAYAALAESDVVLVVGSSLTLFSGFRFVKAAASQGLPIYVVNRGVTRADPLAKLRVAGDCATLLPQVVRSLASA